MKKHLLYGLLMLYVTVAIFGYLIVGDFGSAFELAFWVGVFVWAILMIVIRALWIEDTNDNE